MKEELQQYIISLIDDVPHYVYVILLSIFFVGSVVLFVLKGRQSKRYIMRLLLAVYVLLIYCSTVFFRIAEDVRKYDFTPFWSYDNPEYFLERIMNIVVFIPVGFLLGVSISNIKWWKVLLVGICLSTSIEFLQLITKSGFSEIDDIMHNTLGCIIGYLLFQLIYKCVKVIQDRIMVNV